MSNIAKQLPNWVLQLDESDLQFVKQVILASGSLKQLATEYEVSYPTIRQRLDRVIDRIKLFEAHSNDNSFESRIRVLVAERAIEPSLGKELLGLHRQNLEAKHD